MIRVAHFSQADSVKGQGVGSAYLELIQTLEKHYAQELDLAVNDYNPSDISHYHTINFPYFLSAQRKNKRGVRVGYVHFLPDTLVGSIKLPPGIQDLFAQYVLTFYRTMDELVVVNPSFIPDIVDYGFPEEKITYIPNFVSAERFYPESEADRQAFRKDQGIAEDAFVVLGVGQIQKRKGFDDFIALAKDHPDKIFVWCGGFSFGQITDGYDHYKKIYENPPANVIFPGIVERDEMVHWYNACDLFLLPSFNELFPMAILESFACHTPVLLRDLDLYRDVIDGFYAAGSDREAMSQEIERLATDSAYYQELTDAAVRGAETYSEDRVARLWLDYYQGLVEKYK